MSIENFELSEDHQLLNRNIIQAMLAKKHNEPMEVFALGEHADKFREFVASHPDILDRFDKDPEEVLEEVDEVVYH